MTVPIARRKFVVALAGAAAWPLAARAQQNTRLRRIGVLQALDENDPIAKTSVSAFTQALADLDWTVGRNLRMDLRWWGDDINRIRALAQELVGLQPDIIVANGTVPTIVVQRETRTIPIVFADGGDPVANGIVPRLDRPSGNVTGLSEIAPGLKRAAIMFNPDTTLVSIFMPSLETAAQSLKVAITGPFIPTQRSKRPSPPLGASREAVLSSCRMDLPKRIARRSYLRRPETTYRRSIRYLTLPETAVCSPTAPTA
jgi:putative ABC transport system substrate-binding protein